MDPNSHFSPAAIATHCVARTCMKAQMTCSNRERVTQLHDLLSLQPVLINASSIQYFCLMCVRFALMFALVFRNGLKISRRIRTCNLGSMNCSLSEPRDFRLSLEFSFSEFKRTRRMDPQRQDAHLQCSQLSSLPLPSHNRYWSRICNVLNKATALRHLSCHTPKARRAQSGWPFLKENWLQSFRHMRK